MNKLRIINYFDALVSQVDLQIELYIAGYQHVANSQTYIDKLNLTREEWIAEIRECETFNLAHCQHNKEPIQDKILFKRFCFIFEWNRNVLNDGLFTFRLISTDMFLSENEIRCFQVVIMHLTRARV